MMNSHHGGMLTNKLEQQPLLELTQLCKQHSVPTEAQPAHLQYNMALHHGT